MYSIASGYTRTNYEMARSLLALGRPADALAVLKPALRGPLDASNLYVTRTELQALLVEAFAAGGMPDSAAARLAIVERAWRHADADYLARQVPPARTGIAAVAPPSPP